MKKKLILFTMLVTGVVAFGAVAAQAGEKVDVCHLPPGNPYNWHTIRISVNALDAHLNHGDLEGSCAASCDALCDDGDACTQDVQSDTEECICRAVPRPPVNCDDGNPCTLASCDSIEGCVQDTSILDGNMCDDGDAGTENDLCTGGVCAGRPSGPACPCWTPPEFDALIAQFLEPIACNITVLRTEIRGQCPGSGCGPFSTYLLGAVDSGASILACVLQDPPTGVSLSINNITEEEFLACQAPIRAECGL